MNRLTVTTAAALPHRSIFYFVGDKQKRAYIITGSTRKAITYNARTSNGYFYRHDLECPHNKPVVFLRYETELV